VAGGCAEARWRRLRRKAITPQIAPAAAAAPISTHAQPGRPLVCGSSWVAATTPAAATALAVAAAASELEVVVVEVSVGVVEVVVAGGATTVSV
jgi:hypothetical protein